MGATPTNKNPHMTTPVVASGGGGPGSDTTAIHDNEAAEISAIASKATPTSADYLLIEDAADSDNKKKITIAEILALIPRSLSGYLSVFGTAIVQGNNALFLPVPSWMAGKKVTRVQALVTGAAGSGGGTTTINLFNVRLADQVLSTPVTITDTGTVGTPGVINQSNNTLQADDVLRADVATIPGVAPEGVLLIVEVL